MSKFTLNKLSSTLSTIIISGLIQGTCSFDDFNSKEKSQSHRGSVAYTYASRSPNKTFSTNYSLKKDNDDNLLNSINTFFYNLASNQEELESQFSEVLFENVWGLYQV